MTLKYANWFRRLLCKIGMHKGTETWIGGLSVWTSMTHFKCDYCDHEHYETIV